MARCPAHEDSTPSLAISVTSDGRLLVYCHAGCSQVVVIAKLRDRGLWPPEIPNNRPIRTRFANARVAEADAHASRMRIARALQVWCEALPSAETLVEVYLHSRAITIKPPASLRFHAQLRHRSGATWPVMIGIVTSGAGNRPIGVHRTWLARDGRGKAPIEPNKMMLGPCRGGAVRLAPASSPLMIGEGIETCLAAMQATGHPTWAALSTSGMRALVLPDAVREVIVLADGDPPGEQAAAAAAQRWAREGRRVRIARAPHGKDFNDLLIATCFDETRA